MPHLAPHLLFEQNRFSCASEVLALSLPSSKPHFLRDMTSRRARQVEQVVDLGGSEVAVSLRYDELEDVSQVNRRRIV